MLELDWWDLSPRSSTLAGWGWARDSRLEEVDSHMPFYGLWCGGNEKDSEQLSEIKVIFGGGTEQKIASPNDLIQKSIT